MDDLGKDNNFTVTVHPYFRSVPETISQVITFVISAISHPPNATRVAGYFLCGNPTLS